MTGSRTPIAVLISGGGRTLQNFIDLAADGRLPISIQTAISTRAAAGGLQRAEKAKIPAHVVSPKDFDDNESFSRRITEILQEYGVELICLAGFLSLYRFPDCFAGRAMNIHPALLPSFGGKGMYGDRVFKAVWERGSKVTGCTVHFADNIYDHGPIIIQRTCPVLEDDTPDTLADRVFEQEKIAYPEAVRLFCEGRLRIDGPRCRILPKSD
jgi:formyltetrahydrofolate-dependent phosphoribosylglycinamide formyltransferase